MAQHKTIISIIYTLCFSSMGHFVHAASPEAQLNAAMVNPGYHEKPAWFKQSFLDIQEDIEEAASQDKRVILYFYQDGCPYCAKLLHDNFGQRHIAKKTQRHFDLISLNMWGDRDVAWVDGTGAREKRFAARMKVMFTPTMLFLDEKGNIALRLNGYYSPEKFEAVLDYVSGHHEGKLSFRDFYQQRKPDKASGKLHSQPFFKTAPYNLIDLADQNDKPLLVMFEQRQCKECDELHSDVYRRKATLEQLARFNVIRFDMWSGTKLVSFDGSQLTAKQWAKQLRIQYTPTLVFFDKRGKEIIRTEAYLKSFHIQSVMDYAASGAYKKQPSFQRFISARADRLEKQGMHINLME